MRRGVEAGRHTTAGLLPAARPRAAGHRGPRRLATRRRRRARGPSGTHGDPGRLRPRSPALRRSAPRPHLADLEGADVGRLDRATEADRLGEPGAGRHRRRGGPAGGPRGLPRGARPALPQRPVHLLDDRAGARQPRRGPAQVRRRGHAARRSHDHRADVHPAGADDDAADLPPARRRAARYDLSASSGVAHGGPVPAVAQGGMDRLAGRRADLRAVRRHRGPGGQRSSAATSGWSTGLGRPADRGRDAVRRRRWLRPARR